MYCLFYTYYEDNKLYGNDIFTGDNSNSLLWYPETVYHRDEYKYITEVNPKDYPEHFI